MTPIKSSVKHVMFIDGQRYKQPIWWQYYRNMVFSHFLEVSDKTPRNATDLLLSWSANEMRKPIV